ncbi:MAG: PIG-L family deacetylase [Gemmatimonadota bacterium]|nr:PIG-L family deacetylase [Gemmatimonadota bacterium]
MSSRAKRRSATLVVAVLAISASSLTAQLTPPETGGIVALDRLLQQLGESRRVLVIGAHPDDEDTRLLALAAQGLGADAAYLSLSRGEGGQNLIGDELGVALGLLRTRELEAARRQDGARQYFTRAYDFGYSRSLEETAVQWLPDSVLADVVRIVRRFRPHVIVSVFSGTERDGHGQHQMAGVTAQRVFDAASDPDAHGFDEKLQAWQPLKLYRSTRFEVSATTLSLETGGLDPRSGRSYHQIAMASRSRHRSQDMGRLQEIGPQRTRLALVEDRTGAGDAGLFAGIPRDTTWIVRFADSLRAHLSAARLADAAEPLAHALGRARREHRPRHQRELLMRALGIAAGLVLDATANREVVEPGGTVEVTLRLYNGGTNSVPFEHMRFRAPPGWTVEQTDSAGFLEPGAAIDVTRALTAPADAQVSQPYFLRRDRRGALYDWDGADPSVLGEPFEPEPLFLTVTAYVAGQVVVVQRDVTHRHNDQAVGEIRRPVRVVPQLEVRLEPQVLLWSADGPDTQDFTVTLSANGTDDVSGELALEVDRWGSPPTQSFALDGRGASQSYTFTVRKPTGAARDTVSVRAVARTASGDAFDAGFEAIQYDHIDPVWYQEPARGVIRLAPIAGPDGLRVGYVRGAADRVPEALQRVGLDVEVMDQGVLARGDLSTYDVVVIGSRAYETNAALIEHNDRLLAYVRNGGRLVVQYQQYQFVRGNYAPYRLTIRRPHDRVTDETAPVRMLEPTHPVFHAPNRISELDWLAWPQERGLYFASEWDGRYTPLLEMKDPGMPPVQGGLLVASYGEGTYVYTGISFFRSLPAGTPGAYRLFLNLLAYEGTDGR